MFAMTTSSSTCGRSRGSDSASSRGWPCETTTAAADPPANICSAIAQLLCERRLLLRADDDELQSRVARLLERGERVLARLHRADEQRVSLRRAARRERRVDAVRCHGDLAGRDVVQ